VRIKRGHGDADVGGRRVQLRFRNQDIRRRSSRTTSSSVAICARSEAISRTRMTTSPVSVR
jgi:hypothetical protein